MNIYEKLIMIRAKAIHNLPNIIQDIEALIVAEWEKDPLTSYIHCTLTPNTVSWNASRELIDYFKPLNLQISWHYDNDGKYVHSFDVNIKSFKKYKEDSLEKSKSLSMVDETKEKRAIKINVPG